MPSPVSEVNPNQYIFVPSKFQIKPGAKITNDLFVGPGLGVGLQVPPLVLAACQLATRSRLQRCLSCTACGSRPVDMLQYPSELRYPVSLDSSCWCLQGGVFLLQDAQGRPDPDKVLKATFKLSLGGIAGMTHMEREWAVGRRLAPLEKGDKGLPGFMATGAAVLTRAGSFRGKKWGSSVFTCLGPV